MYSLVTERGRYLRIRNGVKKDDVVAAFSIPAGELFFGQIIELKSAKRFCYARVGDTYRSIACRERVDDGDLRELNANAVIYPSLRVWLP